jgi:hypothetical protein
VRSSFRDTISKVKKQFQHDENDCKDRIHLIKYDSIDNLFITKNSSKRSSSHIDISNRRYLLTRHHSRYTG